MARPAAYHDLSFDANDHDHVVASCVALARRSTSSLLIHYTYIDMSESAFTSYQQEFKALVDQINVGMEDQPPSDYTENLLRQAEDLVKQMAVEARSVSDPNLKRRLLATTKEAKNEHTQLTQAMERHRLLSSASQRSGNGKERLLMQQNEDMLANQNETLERARRTMQETESVALEITEELGHNREKLQTAHGRIREVSGLTGRATSILNSMSRRATQQKLVLYGVAVALVLGFLVMLWTMWR